MAEVKYMGPNASTVVCVSASERTWKNLERYCFNAPFRAQRRNFALAVGFNGYDADGLRLIEHLEPEHLFIRPNTGHDLANFDNILKRLPAFDRYILLHDDHWFHDPRWLDVLDQLARSHPEVGVWGNLSQWDVEGKFSEYYMQLTGFLGYEEMASRKFQWFLQGLAGVYNGVVVKKILAMDGIPHLHRSVQIAAQVCERLFSGLIQEAGTTFGQIPPGYELYLLHRDHSIVKVKLEEAATLIAYGERTRAEEIFEILSDLRPDDHNLRTRIEHLRAR
jgi:hypothetical protein